MGNIRKHDITSSKMDGLHIVDATNPKLARKGK